MRYLKSYKLFESISSDIDEIMVELQDEGFVVEQSYWVRGARGGYLRSDEWGNQLYGPIATDSKVYLRVEVKNPGREFTLSEVLPYFGRLKDYLENFSPIKYKSKSNSPFKDKNTYFGFFERI
jgi:hypothetical protein